MLRQRLSLLGSSASFMFPSGPLDGAPCLYYLTQMDFVVTHMYREDNRVAECLVSGIQALSLLLGGGLL